MGRSPSSKAIAAPGLSAQCDVILRLNQTLHTASDPSEIFSRTIRQESRQKGDEKGKESHEEGDAQEGHEEG